MASNLQRRVSIIEQAVSGGASSKWARQAAMSAFEHGLIPGSQIDELAAAMSRPDFWKSVAKELQAHAESEHVERQQAVRTIACGPEGCQEVL